MRRPTGWLIMGSLLVTAGCTQEADRATAPDISQSLAHLSASVTGKAAAAVMANGMFALPTQYPGGLSAQQAGDLAVAYAHTAGRLFKSAWEGDRNAGPIDISALRRCGRTYLAENAFAELPTSAPRPLQQRVEARWLVSLCGVDGQAEVNIAVPVRDTSLHLASDGMIINLATANFESTGVRPGLPVPPTPEVAAEQVAAATGRLVAEVPELVQLPPRYPAQLAMWRLALNAPANVIRRDTRIGVVTSDVYFGYGHVASSSTYGLWLPVGDSSATQESPLVLRHSGLAFPLTLREPYADQFARIDGVAK